MDWLRYGVMLLVILIAGPPLQQPLEQRKRRQNGFFLQLTEATPLPFHSSQVPMMSISPYIRHWEPAKYDQSHLAKVAWEHRETRRRRRRRRDLEGQQQIGSEIGIPQEPFRLNFTAHDREFRLVLRSDPHSIFAADVQLESNSGPIDYDLGQVYSGHLEGDENSLVHGVLTAEDSLFDGTITTAVEQYYVEPARRYSEELLARGVHSVVYKVSDVRMMDGGKVGDGRRCASEILHRKQRRKRWLEEQNQEDEDDDGELLIDSGTNIRNSRTNHFKNNNNNKDNPPLPLDLDVPYNDDMPLVVAREDNSGERSHKIEYTGNVIISRTARPTSQNSNSNNNYNSRNILYNEYHPVGGGLNNNGGGGGGEMNIPRNANRNIIGNVFERKRNNFFSNNGSTFSSSSSTTHASRPIHKNHVEIITKRPNIIVNNYNPDVVLMHPLNPSNPTNIKHQNINLNVRNELLERTRSLYDRKSTCMLYLQADHTFFQKMGSDEASIEAITRHVQRANVIYKNTDFNGDGKPDNITFMIKRIKVHNLNALKDPTYRYPGNYGVEKFLELFSEEDYDAFCLAYMFTYRDFEMGTLGLAWTGDLKNAGGVCEKNGHYRGSLKSLNTGIVTLLNYGKHVPPAVSHVTLAHEIGHNFGSPHDPEQCTPGGEDGNYIMFARATSGDKRNNNKFSPCSLKAIEPVLNAKARSAKGCFTEPQESICGNGVVEPGEECDCGWEEDCKDVCCFPMSRHPNIDEKPCTLTPRASCSPSQGPCCTNSCQLKLGDKCRDDNGCRDPSFCDGNSPFCPPSVNKPNKTICNKEFVCFMGECTGSICLAYGLESCQCIPGPSDPQTKSCELCCKQPGENSPCKSSFEWNEPPFDVPDMYAKPGTPCNDYNGYCDVFQKCREVDPSGPLATLRKLLLSEESIASFKKWVLSNWYAVVLILIVVVGLLVLSTKLLDKRTNLKLKTVTIIHSATTETVRLPEDNNGVIVHTAVRTKVPFKKKVRGERAKSLSKSGKNKSSSKTAGSGAVPSKAKKDGKTKRSKSQTAVATTTEETTAPSSKRPKKSELVAKSGKSSGKKEIIDYSNGAGKTATDMSAFGKVQKWLLESPSTVPGVDRSSVLSTDEQPAKLKTESDKVLRKSVSTPERLVVNGSGNNTSSSNNNNSQGINKVKGSRGSPEKVKLHVVYKPPFKFSLKLAKKPAISTTVSAPIRKKRPIKTLTTTGTRLDSKNRIGIMSSSSQDKSTVLRKNRLALLIRTEEEGKEDSERQQLKINDELEKPSSAPVYENVNPEQKLINTATFRVKKSASGPDQTNQNTGSSRHSDKNKSNTNRSRNEEEKSNLSRQFGGSGNLVLRSSTTNLTKMHSNHNFQKNQKGRNSLNIQRQNSNPTDSFKRISDSNSNVLLGRNATATNFQNNLQNNVILFKKLSTSNTNLAKFSDEFLAQKSLSNSSLNRNGTDSRRTSTGGSSAAKRRSSINSQTNKSRNSLRRASVGGNNIPRASLKTKPRAQPNSSQQPQRPHTASCDNVTPFDWKPRIDEPLASDLEVLCSDVENIFADR